MDRGTTTTTRDAGWELDGSCNTGQQLSVVELLISLLLLRFLGVKVKVKKCEMDFTSLLAYRLVSSFGWGPFLELRNGAGTRVHCTSIMAGEMGCVTSSGHGQRTVSPLTYCTVLLPKVSSLVSYLIYCSLLSW